MQKFLFVKKYLLFYNNLLVNKDNENIRAMARKVDRPITLVAVVSNICSSFYHSADADSRLRFY